VLILWEWKNYFRSGDKMSDDEHYWKSRITRRDFLKRSGLAAAGLVMPLRFITESGHKKPNIILLMADDLGYGDVGFNGNKIIKTPHLDEMARHGIRFTRFYAGAPVCSPTRATCLTGRHHLRYGIFSASIGYLPAEEMTLAKMCKAQGYATGFFGKWHLAPITKTGPTMPEYRQDREKKYAPPWERDYDESFVTECNVPTWDPSDNKRFDANSRLPFYHNGKEITEELKGPAARLVMDKAIPFIRKAQQSKQPFFATIWFHEPHEPVVGGPEYRALYKDCPLPEQHYYGCITAMDEQIGRLRRELREQDLADNTMIWFCSDNGPEGMTDKGRWGNYRGVTGGLRGRKRSLFDGGVLGPALLEWPGYAEAGRIVTMPCSTMDYFPTIQNILGFKVPGKKKPIDGINLLPVIQGEADERSRAIPFCSFYFRKEAAHGSPELALVDNNFKLMTNLSKAGHEDLLFDLRKDPSETNNIIYQYPKIAAEMKDYLEKWLESCRQSHSGADYDSPFTPVNQFPVITHEGLKRGQRTLLYL
jgi:arylsulfatase A-like enzyme